MFRDMRRKKQLLSDSETVEILTSCSAGVLAVQGDDDYPYAVPLSYAYGDGKLFFHSATAGHKLEAIERNAKASFCVIADDDVSQSTFTTHFRSAIVFGRMRVLSDLDERRHALDCLARKYSPDFLGEAAAEIEQALERVCVLELSVEHATGKAAREVIQARAASGADA